MAYVFCGSLQKMPMGLRGQKYCRIKKYITLETMQNTKRKESLRFMENAENRNAAEFKNTYTWYEKAVFYHIYPIGMCGAPKVNEGGEPADRIKKLIDFIPHLKSIGISAIYIGPFFESASHGYDTTDYYKVDVRLGTNEDFKCFVEKCHSQGINVIPDGVFNHTGRGFFAFKDLLANRENSQYRDWYCNVNFGGNNEFNDGLSYEAWHGFNILPRLNLKNPAVKEYLKEVIRFWVREFDIDGIRLDTADVLDFDFMKELRQLAGEIKPEFWLLGEVIHGDYSRWVNDEMLHAVTNYELHKGLYSGHNDHNYFEIAHTVKRLFAEGGLVKDKLLYTFVENHDVTRLASKLNNKAHIKNIYTLAFTLPGIPSVYYGGEFALEGIQANGSDDAVRPSLNIADFYETLPVWEDTSVKAGVYKEQYKELAEHIAWLSKLKAENEPLVRGVYKELSLTNRQYAFARIFENMAVITAVNNDEAPAHMCFNVPFGSRAEDLATGEETEITDGKLSVNLEVCEGKIYRVV